MPPSEEIAPATRRRGVTAQSVVLALYLAALCVALAAVVTGGGLHSWGLTCFIAAVLLNSATTPPALPVFERRQRPVRIAAGVIALGGAVAAMADGGPLSVVTGVATALLGVAILISAIRPATRRQR